MNGPRGVLLLAAVVLGGCPANGIYRTARTLEPGEGEVSLSMSMAHNSYERVEAKAEVQGQTVEGSSGDVPEQATDTITDSLTMPNFIPELGFHMGVIDDLEVGGRVALGSMLGELDVKYRFLGNSKSALHLALGPSIGYRTFVLADGMSAQIPLIATYELNENAAINVAGYWAYANLTSNIDEFEDYGGEWFALGGSLGLKFGGEDFYIMPAVDISRTVSTLSVKEKNTGASGDVELHNTYIIGAINLGFYFNKPEEKKRQEEQQKSLDRIEDKLDKLVTPGAAPVSGPASAAPAPVPAPVPAPATAPTP